MLQFFKIVYLIGLLLISCTFAKDESNDINSNLKTKETYSTSLTDIKWNYYNIAALTTALLVVGAGLSALMALFLPVMTYKICYMLGGCQDTLDYYVDQLVADNFNGISRREKRSMEYVEPILTTLINAYEKYADDNIKKKFNKHKF